jgi:LiaF transmembrane domain
MNEHNEEMTPGTPFPSAEAGGELRDQRGADRGERRQGRTDRRGRRHFGWLWGGVLIVLGAELLLENMGYKLADNWWALFILIPAFGSYAAAWDQYRQEDRLTRAAAGSLVSGLLFTIMTLIFFFSIDFGMFWPVLLILAGLALLSVGLIPV